MEGLPINFLMMIILTCDMRSNALLTTKTRSVNFPRMFEILMELFQDCLPTHQSTIGIAYHREMENDLPRKLSRIACLTVVGYAASRDPNLEAKTIFKKISEKKNLTGIEQKWKANAFLTSADSTTILNQVMKKLQNSIWWNISGIFIVTETTPKTNGCKKASDFLWVMWSYGVLSSIYLCLDELDIPRIYTFNPYDHYAPSPWRRVDQSYSHNGHPWTLYQQEYTDGRCIHYTYRQSERSITFTLGSKDIKSVNPSSIFISGRVACNEVVFDKTRNLQGYPIRVNACPREPTLYIHPSKTGREKFSGEDGMIVTSVLQVLNATLIDVSHLDVKCELGFDDDDSIYQGTMANLALTKVDIEMNTRYLRLHKRLFSTYPHTSSQLCFATKIKRSVSSWIVIEALFSNLVHSRIFIVFAVSMIVTKYLEGRNTSNAFLDSVRLILNISVKYLPKTTAGRFVGYAELLVLLVIHTLLTASFVSVLTKPIDNENINTLKELQSVNCPVLALPIFRDTLKHLEVLDRFVAVNNSVSCVTSMIRENRELICVEDCLFLETIINHSNELHVETHKFADNYVTYVTNTDWPLIDRVNVIIQRMVEAGLPNYWRFSNLPRAKQEHTYLLDNRTNIVKSTVLFTNFKYTFRLCVMGLSLACLIFVLEIIFKRLFARLRTKT